MPSQISGGIVYSLSRRKMRKYTLYVVRRYIDDKNYGLWAQSAPCIHCTKMIRNHGFQKVVYIDENKEIKVVKMKNYNTDYISSCNRRFMKI